MGAQKQSKGPSLRRYTPAEKEQAVRLVRKLRDELGTEHGTIGRVARQLGYGEESVRACVRQADIDDGEKPGVSGEQTRPSARRPGRIRVGGHELSADDAVGDRPPPPSGAVAPAGSTNGCCDRHHQTARPRGQVTGGRIAQGDGSGEEPGD